jgi:hypothetical protein
MYGWIWQRLPGGTGARLAVMVLLAAATGLLMWYVVYPWASIHLPLDQSGLG